MLHKTHPGEDASVLLITDWLKLTQNIISSHSGRESEGKVMTEIKKT